MLETIREFGHEQLSPARVPVLRARHREWCLGLIDDFLARWFGPDQIAWKQRMRREQANLRAALERALDPVDGDALAAQRMVGLPWLLWATALSPTEHRRWLHRALDASADPTPERARALVTCGFVAAAQGDLDTARAVASEGRALAQSLDIPDTRAFATHIVGLVSQFSGQTEDARALLNEALGEYHALGVPDHLVAALETHLGMFHLSCGELDEAEAHFRVVRARCEARGERWARIFATDGLGYIALARGDLDGATALAREGLDLAVTFDDTIGLAFAIELVAWTAAARDQPGRAAVFVGAAASLWGSFGQQLYGSRFWQQWREVYVAAASASLGETAFDAAYRHGAGLSHADMTRLALDRDQRDTSVTPSAARLSCREREIVELVAQGMTNREIGDRLYLSHRTVEGHVSQALEKLDLKRRGQLAAWICEDAAAAVI
jgi:ATP/maltotriose-dependent transcriptional regulator MalT